MERSFCNIPTRCVIRHCLRHTETIPISPLLIYLYHHLYPLTFSSPLSLSPIYFSSHCPYPASFILLYTPREQLVQAILNFSPEIILIVLDSFVILFSLITFFYLTVFKAHHSIFTYHYTNYLTEF